MDNTAIVKPEDRGGSAHAALVGATMAPTWLMRWQFRKQEDSSSRRHLMVLGYITVGVYLLSFIMPAVALDFIRPAYLTSAVIFLLTCALRRDVTLRITAPIVFAIALQTWSFFTEFYATQRLGRPMGFGRAELYILESMIPFFVACAMTEVDREARKTLSRAILITVGVSVLFAWFQFTRMDIFLRLAQVYTYKPIDYWDGHPGLRAVGLTTHPNCLAFQALIGFSLIASTVLYKNLSRWDVVGLFFFSGGLVMSQGRTFYIVLFALWVVLIPILVRKQPRLVPQIALVGFICIVLGLTIGYKRFGYALQMTKQDVTQPAGLSNLHYVMRDNPAIQGSSWLNLAPDWEKNVIGVQSSGDSSLDTRLTIWKEQMLPIWPKLMLTGIGPSSGLLLGTGPEDHWVPQGHVMENGYILMAAMYGVPGVVLFSAALLVAIVSAGKVMFDTRLLAERRCAGAVACIAAVIIAVSCASGNTVDGYMFVPMVWMLGGLAVKSTLDGPLIKRPEEVGFFAGSPAA